MNRRMMLTGAALAATVALGIAGPAFADTVELSSANDRSYATQEQTKLSESETKDTESKDTETKSSEKEGSDSEKVADAFGSEKDMSSEDKNKEYDTEKSGDGKEGDGKHSGGDGKEGGSSRTPGQGSAAAVPLPASIWLMFGALGGLAFAARRKQREA